MTSPHDERGTAPAVPSSLLTRVQAKIELRTRRRARGLIQGRERSLYKGSGEDFDDLKYYQPGDSISEIDWKATARSGEPLIKQFNEERVRHISLVCDTSHALAATAADGTSKRDALVTGAGLLCWLAHESGDLVSLVGGDPGRPLQLPSRSSRGHLELLLRTVQTATEPGGHEPDMHWLLERAFRVQRRSSLMFLLTDEANPRTADFSLLRRLTTRHDLVVVRIRDADPLAADALDRPVVDVGAPRRLSRTARESAQVQREAAQFRAARRDEISGMLDRLRVSHLLTDGDSTIVDDMLGLLRRREYRAHP